MVVQQSRSQRIGQSCLPLHIEPLSASITVSADFVNSLLADQDRLAQLYLLLSNFFIISSATLFTTGMATELPNCLYA